MRQPNSGLPGFGNIWNDNTACAALRGEIQQFCRGAAKYVGPVVVAEGSGGEDMVDGLQLPGIGIVAAQHDLTGASHGETQSASEADQNCIRASSAQCRALADSMIAAEWVPRGPSGNPAMCYVWAPSNILTG